MLSNKEVEYSRCTLLICPSSLPLGSHSSPPHSPGDVVNYGGLLFHPRGGHMSILAKVLHSTLELELVRPSQKMETSLFEPLVPAMPEGRYILWFINYITQLISYWLKHVWVEFLTLAAERVQTTKCTNNRDTNTMLFKLIRHFTSLPWSYRGQQTF